MVLTLYFWVCRYLLVPLAPCTFILLTLKIYQSWIYWLLTERFPGLYFCSLVEFRCNLYLWRKDYFLCLPSYPLDPLFWVLFNNWDKPSWWILNWYLNIASAKLYGLSSSLSCPLGWLLSQKAGWGFYVFWPSTLSIMFQLRLQLRPNPSMIFVFIVESTQHPSFSLELCGNCLWFRV